MPDAPAEADVNNRRQLAQPEAGVLGFQLAQGLADVGGEPQGRLRLAQTREALSVEAVGVAGDGALGNAGLRGSFRRWQPEEHDRADHLIVVLLRPAQTELE